jgi:hypothetical protein
MMHLSEAQASMFIDLLIQKNQMLERQNADLEIRLHEAHISLMREENTKRGPVEDLMSVTRKDIHEAEELARQTFKTPRNLGSEVGPGYDANGSEVP